MKTESYRLAINIVFFLGWVVTILPVILYLSTSAGWKSRRDRIFTYFNPSALRVYFKQYFPALDVSADSDVQLAKRFKKHFACYYGARHFIFPLFLLAVLSGVGAWGTAQSVSVWQGLFQTADASTRNSWPPIVVSAFLGAYTWVVFDQLARLHSRDFSSADVYNCVFRFLIAVPFGYALSKFVKDDFGIPLAFLLGAFPTSTLFTIGRRLASQKLELGEEGKSGPSELEGLQNVGRSDAERFQDEGIATIAELAWVDPVDLAIRTNFEFNYVVDCMSQALLALYFEKDVKQLYRFSLRGAQEVASMIYVLETPTIPTSEKDAAAEALIGAAKVLGMESGAFYHTLLFVKYDPYTEFLWQIWETDPDTEEVSTNAETSETATETATGGKACQSGEEIKIA